MLCVAAAALAAAAVPSTMTVVEKSGRSCKAPFACVTTATKPTPAPKKGQLLVEVKGSSVNPCDVDYILSGFGGCGMHGSALGEDMSGVVAAVGSGVTRFKVGDEVWANGGVTGSMAQYAVFTEKQTGLKPAGLSFPEAGTVPLAGLTSLGAWQKIGAPWTKPNLTAVVTAGSGGTGYLGVQLAKAFGAARVLTAATGDGIAFVKSLGADVVVDYTKQEVIDSLADDSVDLVLDNYGARGTACAALPKIRSGGKFIVIPGGNGGGTCAKGKAGVTQLSFGMLDSSDHGNLDIMKGFFDAGKMKAHVDNTYTLAKAAGAYNEVGTGSGSNLGKVAVTP